MSVLFAEMVGTALLVLLGNGVVANVVLNKTKGHNGGWIVITAGWGFLVMVAAYVLKSLSGGHLHPARPLGPLRIGKVTDPSTIPQYFAGQFLGGVLGGMLVWLTYLPHWRVTEDGETKRAAFCTSPAIRHPLANLTTEVIGTFVLVLGILAITSPANLQPGTGWEKSFAPFLVGMLVFSIGLSLGGPTGYAINPARDLGPRIAHFMLPIPGKASSDWGYAWVPVVGPLIGGAAAAMIYAAQWGSP